MNGVTRISALPRPPARRLEVVRRRIQRNDLVRFVYGSRRRRGRVAAVRRDFALVEFRLDGRQTIRRVGLVHILQVLTG